MSIFGKKLQVREDSRGVAQLVELIRAQVNDSDAGGAAVARSAISFESISEAQVHGLRTAHDTLSHALESIASELKISGQLTEAQKDAGIAAGLMAGDPGAYLRSVTPAAVATESMSVVNVGGLGDSFGKRTFGLEAYDEKDNRNAVVYSIGYNMQAARQDEFGEAFFPTVVVSPDNLGLAVTVRLFQVFDDFTRNVSGAISNYNKKNIIRALIDSTILKNDQTRIIPVVRTDSLAKFVPAAAIPARAVLLEGESINTAPLAIGKKLDLLAISQTDALLANGLMGPTDSIDPAVVLQNLYFQVSSGSGGTLKTDTLQFNVTNLPTSAFAPSAQDLQRQMNLAFTTTSILVNANTKNFDTTVLGTTGLAAVVANNWIVRLEVKVAGAVNLELGDTSLYGAVLNVSSVRDSSGNLLDMTTGAVATAVAAIEAGSIIGYDLSARRTNLNRRQRGQLIDTTYYTQLYPVPLRSPITGLRPVTADGQTDSSDLAALITATHIRTSNAAVGALLQADTNLAQYVDARDSAGNGPDVLGVGRFLVKATYSSVSLNLSATMDSLSAHERAADIQATLVNQIRDMAYRLYRDSGYKAASDAMYGGLSKVPTVIIGTDPVLHRYLIVEGDLRTLGAEFDVRIVPTLDNRMTGRIFVTFGQFDGESQNKPNPLHFGTMAWKPELTLVLPISRAGQVSKELTVQPSFLHLVNMPILGSITVTGVENVAAAKVAVNFHSV